MNQFINYYNRTKKLIKKEIELVNIELLKENNPYVQENMKVFGELNKNGKLIRGILITLGYYFKNENIAYSIPLAASYELFQTSVLVHDDIIDKALYRRGRTTINNYNALKYQKLEDNIHLGNSIALCIGDYNLNYVIMKMVNDYANDPNLTKLLQIYTSIVSKTIKGQIIDVILPCEEKSEKNVSNLEEHILKIYTNKTAYYTIIGPLVMGMTLSGCTPKEIEEINKVALPLGIAFQIQDDLLDIFSDKNDIGKPVGNDISEFKQTLLYAYTKNTNYYSNLLNYYGKENFDVKKVQEIFINSGAKKYCEDKMNELYLESLNSLDNIKWLNNNSKNILKDFIYYLNSRDK